MSIEKIKAGTSGVTAKARDIEIIFDRGFVSTARAEKIEVSGFLELMRRSESDVWRKEMGLDAAPATEFSKLMRNQDGWYQISEDRPMIIKRMLRADAEKVPWQRKLRINNIDANALDQRIMLHVLHGHWLEISAERKHSNGSG